MIVLDKASRLDKNRRKKKHGPVYKAVRVLGMYGWCHKTWSHFSGAPIFCLIPFFL